MPSKQQTTTKRTSAPKRAPAKKRRAEANASRRRTRANAPAPERRRGRKGNNNKELPFSGDQLEKPPPLHHRVAALIGTAYPGKRKASNAYDDRIVKRHCHQSVVGMPWEAECEIRTNFHGQRIESPPYTRADLLGRDDLLDGNSFEAMGIFKKLPAEIRHLIFRELLVHSRDIKVFKNWSLLYPRSRPNLEAVILRVCRGFYREGIRILYGENTFLYQVRDPPRDNIDNGIVEHHVYNAEHIPIDKYGHLIRNIKIIVEANRMRNYDARLRLPDALQKFLPDHGLTTPAQLHTVTIEMPAQNRKELGMTRDSGTREVDVPAASWFQATSPVFKALSHLNCQFIRLLLYRPDKEKNTSYHYWSIVMDRHSHFTELSASDGHHDIWAADGVMQKLRRAEAIKSRDAITKMHYRYEFLVDDETRADETKSYDTMTGHYRREYLVNGEKRVKRSGPFKYLGKVQAKRNDRRTPESLSSGSSERSSRQSPRVNYALNFTLDDVFDDDFDDDFEPDDEGERYDEGDEEYEEPLFVPGGTTV